MIALPPAMAWTRSTYSFAKSLKTLFAPQAPCILRRTVLARDSIGKAKVAAPAAAVPRAAFFRKLRRDIFGASVVFCVYRTFSIPPLLLWKMNRITALSKSRQLHIRNPRPRPGQSPGKGWERYQPPSNLERKPKNPSRSRPFSLQKLEYGFFYGRGGVMSRK